MASILEEEEPQEPSCEELLLDLEQELSKICPWTCPNKVRILLGKIAYKVHKEKDPGQFYLTLFTFDQKKWHFFFNFQWTGRYYSMPFQKTQICSSHFLNWSRWELFFVPLKTVQFSRDQ